MWSGPQGMSQGWGQDQGYGYEVRSQRAGKGQDFLQKLVISEVKTTLAVVVGLSHHPSSDL